MTEARLKDLERWAKDRELIHEFNYICVLILEVLADLAAQAAMCQQLREALVLCLDKAKHLGNLAGASDGSDYGDGTIHKSESVLALSPSAAEIAFRERCWKEGAELAIRHSMQLHTNMIGGGVRKQGDVDFIVAELRSKEPK